MLILFFSRADYRAAFYRLPLGKSLLARDLAYFSFLPLCSPNCFAAFYAVLCYAIMDAPKWHDKFVGNNS